MSRFYVLSGLAFLLSVLSPAWAPSFALAGEADIVAADARKDTSGRRTFAATVAHADTGWDHYADRFEILSPDGTMLATRVLVHPHENKQPFTRSLGGVKIPSNTRTVTVRAGDLVHKFGGKTKTIVLKD